MKKEDKPVTFTEGTVFSLHVVAIIVAFTAWITRISEKVDQQEKALVHCRCVNKDE